MEIDFYNAIGYVGTGLYLLSYYLLQMDKIDQGMQYTLLNLFASLFVGISLTAHFNAPALVIQVVWFVLSMLGIYRLITLREVACATKKP